VERLSSIVWLSNQRRADTHIMLLCVNLLITRAACACSRMATMNNLDTTPLFCPIAIDSMANIRQCLGALFARMVCGLDMFYLTVVQ